MARPFNLILDALNTLATKAGQAQTEQPYSSPDMVNVITQAVADIDLIGVLQDMIGQITDGITKTQTPSDILTGNPPVQIIERRLEGVRPETFKSTMEKFAKSASLPVVDGEAFIGALVPHILGHMGVVSAISVVSMVAEALSIGQVDRLLEDLHAMYGLLDTPIIYSQIRDERIAVEWRRPFRYLVEKSLQNNLPPTSDLITFLVREVILYDDFELAMSYQGFSPAITKMYWDSHFVMPTTQEVYDMEALGMINEVQGKAQLVINDISPLWVDKIWDLRKRLPSRTETRMMLRRKKMPDELLERIFRFERIHPDYIEYYKFMLLNWDIDSIFGRIINEAIGHYQDGLMNEETFRATCANHLATVTEVDAYTELAKMRQDERRREEQKDMYVALFKKNYRDRDTTTASLVALNFDATDIHIWLDKSEVDALPKLTIEQVEYGTEEEEET